MLVRRVQGLGGAKRSAVQVVSTIDPWSRAPGRLQGTRQRLRLTAMRIISCLGKWKSEHSQTAQHSATLSSIHPLSRPSCYFRYLAVPFESHSFFPIAYDLLLPAFLFPSLAAPGSPGRKVCDIVVILPSESRSLWPVPCTDGGCRAPWLGNSPARAPLFRWARSPAPAICLHRLPLLGLDELEHMSTTRRGCRGSLWRQSHSIAGPALPCPSPGNRPPHLGPGSATVRDETASDFEGL